MELQMPVVPEGFGHAWYVFTVRMKGANAAKRNNVVKRIRERFIDAKIYYPKPIHLFPYYRDHFGSVRLPRTETTMKQVFSLPVHPGVRENEINRIVNVVKNALT
jgi:dTDP-4-amino-4,6-dideoxygalactose transaminase